MALNFHCLTQILRLCQLVNQEGRAPIKVLSVGYPDLVLTKRSYAKFLKDFSVSSDVTACQATVMDWHRLDSSRYVALSLKKILQAMYNVEFNYFDINEGTGLSEDIGDFIRIDLNHPVSLVNRFDIIVDSGTAEHCFNIGNVFFIYHQLLSGGGFLYQWTPFISPNHGFYSINPTLYYDLAREGLFQLEDYRLHLFANYRAYFKCKSRFVPFRPTSKFRLWPFFSSSTMLNEVILRKSSDQFTFPVQSKYVSG
jgi:hypothetical protein